MSFVLRQYKKMPKQFYYEKWRITRRKLLEVFGFGAISTVITAACRPVSIEQKMQEEVMTTNNPQTKDLKAAREGQFLARPSKPTSEAAKPGLHSLQIDKNHEALLYVPKVYKPENPAPFALMLHGAGGNAQHGISLLQNFADTTGIILLAPKSLNATWDVIADKYGIDVGFIDLALKNVFDYYAIDQTRLAVGGFSDGASYALSLGIINGELFSHVIAFSPGFIAPNGQSGKPRFYISHGIQDRVLPIERCSRRLVPQIKRAGYDVLYREFDGPHTIPPDIVHEAIRWFTQVL
jgi:predicted esterase